MTDPVSTNKLRELQALSGGILSRNLLEGSGVWKINRDVTRALADAADEVDRLRDVIEFAPHAPDCDEVITKRLGAPHPLPCDCWKANALWAA